MLFWCSLLSKDYLLLQLCSHLFLVVVFMFVFHSPITGFSFSRLDPLRGWLFCEMVYEVHVRAMNCNRITFNTMGHMDAQFCRPACRTNACFFFIFTS
jgi:hypothetical protein